MTACRALVRLNVDLADQERIELDDASLLVQHRLRPTEVVGRNRARTRRVPPWVTITRVPTPRIPPREIVPLLPADADRILAVAAGDRSRCGRLAHAVLATLRYPGLRCPERCSLKIADLDLDLDVGSGRIEVVGKGSVPRVVPVA